MTREWTETFVAALRTSPNVSAAARAAGIERTTAYARRKVDQEFAAAWEEAEAESTDALVGEMYRRAVKGCEKPVYYQGVECGRLREYSDTLAIFLAKAHRPEVYRERVEQQHTGKGGGPVEVNVTLKVQAEKELDEWRREQQMKLSSFLSVPPTAPTSSTPIA